MGLAAGAYLQHVRVLRKVSRVRLVAQVGMSDDQIIRMEQGRNAMLGPALLLKVAPLWELVPWPEAKSYWNDLLVDQYEWSSIGKQLREKGIMK